MSQTIAVIGAQGMLGRPVVRRLLNDGFAVKAIARRPEQAKSLLPPAVQWTQGDLADPGSLESALEGTDAVYLTVDTPPGAAFRPETDGLRNLVQALKQKPQTRLMILSALGQSIPGAEKHPWWHIREKAEAQTIAKTSGLPWTIWEPTWFMESLPLFIRNHKATFLKGMNFSAYWIAGDDFGRMISAAITKGEGVGKTIPVQGPDVIDFNTAMARFTKAFGAPFKRSTLPHWLLSALGLFSPRARDLATLLKLCAERQEPAPDPVWWDALAKPALTIETYAASVRKTGDFPQK